MSMKADAVVSDRVIRPRRIAEIERTIGEGDVGYRSPDGIGQIGASFDRDGNIGRAGDGETELIALYSEAAVAGLDTRIPQHGRNIVKVRAPARGSWQIINLCVRVEFVRQIVFNAGSIPQKIDPC